jgi:hypothetical protein
MNDHYWPFSGPRSFLFATSSEPGAASAAVRSWPAGPPDLCVTSPSAEARLTALRACEGHAVKVIEDALLSRRSPAESAADFDARRAEALRFLHELDTHSTLVVSDDLFAGAVTPFVCDDATLLRRARAIERSLPLP